MRFITKHLMQIQVIDLWPAEKLVDKNQSNKQNIVFSGCFKDRIPDSDVFQDIETPNQRGWLICVLFREIV